MPAAHCTSVTATTSGVGRKRDGGPYGQRGEGGVGATADHRTDAEGCHPAETMIPCLVPYFVMKCLPKTC